jgi:hypothetical protein
MYDQLLFNPFCIRGELFRPGHEQECNSRPYPKIKTAAATAGNESLKLSVCLCQPLVAAHGLANLLS